MEKGERLVRRSLDLAFKTRQLRFVALLLVMVAVLVSACDSGTPSNSQPTTPPGNNSNVQQQNPPATSEPYTKVDEVGIILKDDSILPNNLGLPAGKIKFTVTNQGAVAHDLVISNDSGVVGKTPVFSKADGPKTLEVTLQPGTYKMASDAPGDSDKGLTGTVAIK
jgi:hypothetical protein